MLLYIITFIIGSLIAIMLYGKVSMVVSLFIAFIIGGLIGYIDYKIKQKKAEREYVEWQKRNGFIN